jgi:ectoine hydroxylase-related dioxygenase (phytanoyl-CoA dioxygenase family)
MSPPTFASDPEGALRAYHEVGFHLEPDVWSAAECERLIAAGETLPAVLAGRRAPVMNPHRVEPAFLAALRNPTVTRILARLCGGRLVGLQSQLFFCPPGTPGFSLHQDNFYVQARSDAFASAWSALEDVDEENGGLIVWPGTHREPVLPVEDVPRHRLSATQDPNANARQVVLPRGYAVMSVVVPRGGVVFLHGHVVHSSHDNRSLGRWRRSLLMTYIRAGEPFRPGRDAGRAAVSLDAQAAG